MIIGIDAREIQNGVTTGIGRALAVYLDYFKGLRDEDRAVLFSSRPLSLEPRPRLATVVAPESMTFLWDQVTLPRLVNRHRVDVFFSPYYKIPLLSPTPAVSTIFDLMYLRFEGYRRRISPAAWMYYRSVGALMARKTATVFTCSEHSKREIIDFYRIPAEKVMVIPLGLDRVYRPVTDSQAIRRVKESYGIPGDYVLYAGNFKPHKNVVSLIAAFRDIAGEFPAVTLVLAGPKDAHFEGLRTTAEECSAIVTGTIPIEDQVALYSGATVFVTASLYEGFGYPPLEAMACGAPVISSNAGSLPEVVAEAGILVDGGDRAALAGRMREVLSSPDLRRRLSVAGLARAAEFSQEKYASRLHQLLLRAGRSGSAQHLRESA